MRARRCVEFAAEFVDLLVVRTTGAVVLRIGSRCRGTGGWEVKVRTWSVS